MKDHVYCLTLLLTGPISCSQTTSIPYGNDWKYPDNNTGSTDRAIPPLNNASGEAIALANEKQVNCKMVMQVIAKDRLIVKKFSVFR